MWVWSKRIFLKTSKWKLKELSICMTPLPQISLWSGFLTDKPRSGVMSTFQQGAIRGHSWEGLKICWKTSESPFFFFFLFFFFFCENSRNYFNFAEEARRRLLGWGQQCRRPWSLHWNCAGRTSGGWSCILPRTLWSWWTTWSPTTTPRKPPRKHARTHQWRFWPKWRKGNIIAENNIIT